jgi:alginate O-acetyltransferase complex protein AlgI
VTFNSIEFFAFFAVVLLLYYRFGVRGQNRLMFVAGSIFYAAFDWRFLGLLYLSTIVDYVVGRGLAATDEASRRKALLATSLVVQIGILAIFKYFDFFSTSFTDALGWVGLTADPVTLDILLPVGISFYTFQTLAYVFAVYRRQLEAERDLATFAAFVAWFPQLVAGPIERATSLLPQVRRRRNPPDRARIESAATLILRGLFKKVVVADGLATMINTVYSGPSTYRWSALVLATVGFAVQVYGDFSGYSDIARGTSRLLGVELRWNFEQPFLSRNMREFWQRWHTSLGWWFTEFVGQPLGGGRSGRVRAISTVLVIFTLIGLWHGPSWTFVFWGFYNGVLVAIWRSLPVPRGQHPMKVRLVEAPKILGTFALFCIGAVFFRAPSFHDAWTVLGRIASLKDGLAAPENAELVPIMLAIVFALDVVERRRRIAAIEGTRTPARLGGVATVEEAAYESVVHGMSPVAGGVVVSLMVFGIAVFSGGAPQPFIYFQF